MRSRRQHSTPLRMLAVPVALVLAACGDSTGPDDDDRLPPPPPPPPPQLVTNFDDGSLEGWGTRGPNTGLILSSLAVTQPFGVVARGTNLTVDWWFVASSLYSGDLSAYYGGDVSYQHRYDGTFAPRRRGPDIRIEASNGRILTYEHAILQPRNEWRDHIAFLREGEGWFVDNVSATEADIRAVLRSVRTIEIRGSRRQENDQTIIDRVILMPPFQ